MPLGKKQLPDLKIGIIGAGQLGLTMAQVFIRSFLPVQNLFISFKGSPHTKKTIEGFGLSDQVVPVEELCMAADLVFIFIRPQSFIDFRITLIGENTLFVSGMAGIPLASLQKVFGKNVCRIMTSGPDTIRQNKAMAAICPFNETVNRIITTSGFTPMILNNEQELHYFTVGVCLPAALVLAKKIGIDVESEFEDLKPGYAVIRQLYVWAKGVIPEFASDKDAEDYVHKMATPGGITEAILINLRKNRDLLQAVEAGVERSMAISDEFS
ncbi:pyrroline-5-carboxylate reductase family protein [Mucilaginibacter gotjawali]|uniref:Pyrroline-5-carboxylate reductase n=2 Tax=Mucilaginibacter gotjawali TaxID=1550579 RepID=A0A839SK94_9SPHI|nr:NAD(P)-binding domain-containing protein [Mucilaginibacter gotjawali]MBB3056897.1 pyrroline-5-carboxylate reductase [Mucilaginibacter gotjawali]BAU55977.1 pyrroline-5-carboxylate reductase [Mucilaginibacter gotjawali]